MTTTPKSSQSKLKNSVFYLLGLLILTAVGAQFLVPKLYPAKASVPLPLSALLPNLAPGWKIMDMPLAETETLQLSVSNILRYDDTLYRTFAKGPINFSVYISYWFPGKLSYYDAGVHTPDTCWVYNGWTRQSRSHAVPLALGAGLKTKPAEVGAFSKDHGTLHVAFWHLVGGRVNTYDQFSWHDGARGHAERFPNYIQDFLKYGLNQRQEQCFVRISANTPIKDLFTDPEVAAIVRSLAPLGLFDETSTAGKSSGATITAKTATGLATHRY